MPPKHARVRIAPSPTGFFHIGTARTALFNWLFVRKEKGVFIIRIEDTDEARSNEAYERIIFESLEWLGLDYDEGPEWKRNDGSLVKAKGKLGPYRQSERREIYQKHLSKLLEKGAAYWCFCTTEELEAERQSMLAEGIPPKYSGKCRSIGKEEATKKEQSGISPVLRFKMPSERVSFTDLVRGKVEFDLGLIGDVVIAKGLDRPLFDVANIIDDELMEISHVIRGEDHIPNTPKQIAMARILGFRELAYAHIPLILNADRSKMSKRSSSTALADYQKDGYVPEAFINFLALLGWHPQGKGEGQKEEEMFTPKELVSAFTLDRVQKSGAIFNLQKLEWLNGQYLKKIDTRTLSELAKPFVTRENTFTDKTWEKIIILVRERMRKLSDIEDLTDLFFALPPYDAELLNWRDTSSKDTLIILQEITKIVAASESKNYSMDSLKNALKGLIDEKGTGMVYWPLRVAVSGKKASPPPLEIMEILGKDETLKRLSRATERLKEVLS